MVDSWYTSNKKFTAEELAYITVLEESFVVPDELKEPIPYIMTDYQKEFHSESINIKREHAVDILFDKSRGISFTTSSLIDFIVSAASFNDFVFPIIAQRKETGLEILELCKWLVTHCKLKEIRDNVDFTERSMMIRFTNTNSRIIVFPGSNSANAVRSLRLMRAMLDEYAFQQSDKELWSAVDGALTGMFAQKVVGSTPNGTQNHYNELTQKCKVGMNEDIGFYYLKLPLFDPILFNPKKRIQDQLVDGLVPIAPWVNLKKAEQRRALDINVFLQEHQCDRLDDSISFISTKSVLSVIDDSLKNLKEKFGTVYETKNPVFIGCDVAEKIDLFSLVAFEEITYEDSSIEYKQIFLDYFRGKKIPELETYCNDVVRMFPTLSLFWVDETGVGSGLVGYLKRNHGSRIKGVNFSKRVLIGDAKESTGIRTVMLTNLKRCIEDCQVRLLNDTMQLSHLTSLDYSMQVTRDKDKGHGDILFACALALLKSRYSSTPASLAMSSNKKSEVEIKKMEEMSIMERVKFYERENKRKRIR